MDQLAAYHEVRDQIKTGDLLQWRGRYPFSKVIRTGTKQFFNHSSFVIRLTEFSDHVYSIEALDNGLFMYRLSSLLAKYDGRVEVFHLAPQYDNEAIAAAAWLLDRQGTAYDWSGCASNRALLYERLGLDHLAGAVDIEPADESQLYCSESVFMAYAEGPQLAGMPSIEHLQGLHRPPVPGNEMLDMKLWNYELDESNFGRGTLIAAN